MSPAPKPAPRLTVAQRPERPVLLWDGDCGFCARLVRRLQKRVGSAVETLPLQDRASRYPEIPESALREAVHLVEPDGTVSRGAEAVLKAWGQRPGWGVRFLLWRYRSCPYARGTFEGLYRFVARRRRFFSRLTGTSCGPSSPR